MTDKPRIIDEQTTQELLKDDPLASATKKYVYQCVFHQATGCGGEIVETAIDPCAVLLVGDYRHDDEQREDNWQQWYCHAECFVKVTGRSKEDLMLRDELIGLL